MNNFQFQPVISDSILWFTRTYSIWKRLLIFFCDSYRSFNVWHSAYNWNCWHCYIIHIPFITTMHFITISHTTYVHSIYLYETVEIYFYLKSPQMRIFYSVDFRPLDCVNLLGRSACVINSWQTKFLKFVLTIIIFIFRKKRNKQVSSYWRSHSLHILLFFV